MLKSRIKCVLVTFHRNRVLIKNRVLTKRQGGYRKQFRRGIIENKEKNLQETWRQWTEESDGVFEENKGNQ